MPPHQPPHKRCGCPGCSGSCGAATQIWWTSRSALALAKNPVFHGRSKHIRIKYHFIRDCLEDGSIKAEHIPITDQLADILTKSLGKTKFQEMREKIGLKQITQH